MFLKSLALQGFKSFPEYTLIKFHPGVTAIVGPNGSGKSNVTDAIRWVLGEQSVRTLRGGQMEDVIFSGTEQRRAMSFAEVSMTVDNSDGGLPIDFAEVEITRRLFRSGESEYMINRQSCRLKDIVSLFYDTGLGKDGYSIIGQGQVDHILSNKSEDRRRIFEEAAGIQKHKAKRDEALRKQEHTEQNLLRLTDILNEVEARLTPLEKQAAKAARWTALRADLKKNEIALILARLDSNEAELQRLQANYEILTADRQAAEEKRQEHVRNRDQLGGMLAASEDERQKLLSHRAEVGEALHEARQSLEISREREEQYLERLRREGQTRTETLAFVEQAKTNLEEQLAITERLKKENSALHLRVAAAARTADRTTEALRLTEEKRKALEADQTALQAEQAETERQEIRLDEQKKLQEIRRAEQLRDFAEVQKQLDEAAQNLASCRGRAEQAAAELALREQEQAETNTSIADLADQLKKNEATFHQCENQLSEALYRRDTLKDLADRMIGYSEAVKKLADYIKQRPELQRQVQGTVGDLLVTPPEYTVAIETALGASVQNIVVTDNRIAADLIDVLKQKRYGRATFMPLEAVDGQRADQRVVEAAATVPGYIGLAVDLVRYESAYQGVMCQLLGRVLVVRDLEAGFQVSQKTGRRWRIVSLAGEVLNPGGSVTGGWQKQKGSRGLLGRNAELANLIKSLPDLKTAVKTAESRVVQVTRRLSEKRQQAQQLFSLMDQARRKRVEAAALLDQQQSLLERLKETTGDRQKELDAYGRTMADLSAAQTDLADRKMKLRERVVELEKNLKALQSQEQRERLATDRHLASLREVEAELRTQSERTEAADHLASVYRTDLENRKKELDRFETSFAEIETERKTNRTLFVTAEAEQKEYAAQIESLDQTLSELENKRRRQSQQREGAVRAAEEAAALLQKLTSEQIRLEGRLDRLTEAGNLAKNRLWTEYELTYLNADEWRLSEPDVAVLDQTVKRLQKKLKELGNVNPQALLEYDELKARYEFMRDQQADVEQSMQDLTAVIRELTGSMREQFSRNLEAINGHFQKTFVALFGGGRGEIILLNSDDVLTADIEIRACPPGKKLQNMLLLSGGERCLTAIALLFAILALRPTPFCIMDEVEAALDDSNIFRFTDYISRYSEASQFVLVTHRKGTMEAADRIYGVTMPERGISKILSMQLEEN